MVGNISHKIPSRQGSPDDFQTPPIALEPLIPFLNPDWTIWECAVGKGNLSKELMKKGFNVIETDILGGNFDFLTQKPIQWDCIITNPPFSLKQEFLQRCYELGTPFALLLPLTGLEGKKRGELFRKYGIQLIIPNKRINFETPSGKGGGSWFQTVWFCYGLNLPKELNFVKLEESKQIKL